VLLNGQLVDVTALALLIVTGEPFCAGCGCWEQGACEGGCAWLPGAKINGFEVALCTRCADKADKPANNKRGRGAAAAKKAAS